MMVMPSNQQGDRQMSNTYNVEYTDTFAGEANYSWVRRATVTMPELTHYGYDGGTNYCKANKAADRQLMRRAKAAMGLTGVRGTKEDMGDTIAFRPYGSCTVMFVSFAA
jgi:hypothetical protein